MVFFFLLSKMKPFLTSRGQRHFSLLASLKLSTLEHSWQFGPLSTGTWAVAPKWDVNTFLHFPAPSFPLVKHQIGQGINLST